MKNLKEIENLFLEKIPNNIKIEKLKEHICEIESVLDVHHIHVWSMDGCHHYATMHIVTDHGGHEIKEKIRQKLLEHNIGHVTLELETPDEHCHGKHCHVTLNENAHHHHHHHHHH